MFDDYFHAIERDQRTERNRRKRQLTHIIAIGFLAVLGVLLLYSLRGITIPGEVSAAASAFPGLILFVILAVFTIAIYFLPTFVTWGSRHVNLTAIFVLNIFLGWTFLGWVLALVWACMDSQCRKN